MSSAEVLNILDRGQLRLIQPDSAGRFLDVGTFSLDDVGYSFARVPTDDA
jgi:hypothetical protein